MRKIIQRLSIFTLLSLVIAGCTSVVNTADDPANPIAITGSASRSDMHDVGALATPYPADSSSPSLTSVSSEDVSGKSGELPFVRSTPLGVEPFPIVLNKSVQVYVDRYLSSPKGLEGSFKRSSPYMPEMVSLLRDRGLPPDLVYLTFAESEFSKDGAGPWQLSRETARRFGLAVNNWVDERRDPVKSTRAAADYLSSLHEQTGDDWPMTLVAWNNGESGVNRYINQESSSYERLLAALPYRTRALLNRFMAVAFIAKSHRQFGFTTADPQGTAPYRTVGVPGGTPLKLVAAKTHTSLATLRGLNPGLLRGCTPPSAYSYPVRIPQGPLQTSL